MNPPSSSGPAPGYLWGAEYEERLTRLLQRGGRRERIGSTRRGAAIEAWHWLAPGCGTENAAGGGNPGTAATGRGLAPPASIRRGVLLVSLLHPMEWVGSLTALALLEAWLDPLGNAATALPAGTPITVVPVANPDGRQEVEESLRRQTRRWVRGSGSGVDLNRNFPESWRPRARGLRFWPLYRPGSRPLSEPETAALFRLAEEIRPRLTFSLHSFGRWIFHPPAGRRGGNPANEPHALLAATALGRHPGSGYRSGALGRWSFFFRAHGTEIDTFARRAEDLAYLIEISQGGRGWGLRRLLQPFFLFNPPSPEREIGRVLPVLLDIARSAFADQLPGDGAPAAGAPPPAPLPPSGKNRST